MGGVDQGGWKSRQEDKSTYVGQLQSLLDGDEKERSGQKQRVKGLAQKFVMNMDFSSDYVGESIIQDYKRDLAALKKAIDGLQGTRGHRFKARMDAFYHKAKAAVEERAHENGVSLGDGRSDQSSQLPNFVQKKAKSQPWAPGPGQDHEG